MRIAFDAKRAFENSTGLGVYSRQLIRGLAEHADPSWALYLFCPNKSKKENFLIENQKIKNIYPNRFFSATGLGRSFWRRKACVRDVQKNKIDLYHGLSHELPIGLSCKKVVTFHDLLYLEFPEDFTAADRKLFDLRFRRSANEADRIVSVSQHTKNALVKNYQISEKKITVVPQTCHSQFHKKLSEGQLKQSLLRYGVTRPYVLNVGSFVGRKNQLFLLQVFAELSPNFDVDLVLVGKGKEAPKLKKFVSEKNLSSRVHFIENIDFKDLPAFYQKANVFAYPTKGEGFGIPLHEAMASRCPIVLGDWSCNREVAGEGHIYVGSQEVSKWSHALQQALREAKIPSENQLLALCSKSLKLLHAEKLRKVYSSLF